MISTDKGEIKRTRVVNLALLSIAVWFSGSNLAFCWAVINIGARLKKDRASCTLHQTPCMHLKSTSCNLHCQNQQLNTVLFPFASFIELEKPKEVFEEYFFLTL